MSNNSSFFKTQSESSWVKAKIISSYFPQYCKIIIRKHEPKLIRYIDLYAGPGKYDDGNESTPLMIANECYRDKDLRRKVWMLFNDKEHIEKLKENFYNKFPKGTFSKEPFFADRIVGENPKIDEFLSKSTMINNVNEEPSLLFIDPFGYKGIKTRVLVEFLRNWGNEIFIFVNSKRINAALQNKMFSVLMNELFPLSYESIKKNINDKTSVLERVNFIVNNLGAEFEKLIGKKIYYTAFQFQEEDSKTTSHFILHITKNSKGYELVKAIYNDFANVGTEFDGIHTYTFDAKNIDSKENILFDDYNSNIIALRDSLYEEYRGRIIDAKTLFDEHQKNTKYCLRHYTEALRWLVSLNKIRAVFTDNKRHFVSVLISPKCILDFK